MDLQIQNTDLKKISIQITLQKNCTFYTCVNKNNNSHVTVIRVS